MFKNFENKYVGKRCFIIGSGPSLIKENLSLLKNEKIFIVNRAYKALQLGLPHYDFHVCVDKRVYEENYKEIQNNTKFPRFYNHAFLDSEHYWNGPKEKFIPIFRYENKNSILYKSLLLNIMPSQYYDGWGKTGSVIIDAVLIAFFLGFKEIYMLGNDLSYEDNKRTHFYGGGSDERRFSSEIKSAIFSSDSLALIIKNLNKFFDLSSVKMINLSKGYKHEGLFKKGRLEDLY